MRGFGAFLLLAALYSACTGNAGQAAACFFLAAGFLAFAPAPRGQRQLPPGGFCRPCGYRHPPGEPHCREVRERQGTLVPLIPDLRCLYRDPFLDPPDGIHPPF